MLGRYGTHNRQRSRKHGTHQLNNMAPINSGLTNHLSAVGRRAICGYPARPVSGRVKRFVKLSDFGWIFRT